VCSVLFACVAMYVVAGGYVAIDRGAVEEGFAGPARRRHVYYKAHAPPSCLSTSDQSTYATVVRRIEQITPKKVGPVCACKLQALLRYGGELLQIGNELELDLELSDALTHGATPAYRHLSGSLRLTVGILCLLPSSICSSVL
jgi:hypothetical protein